MIVPYIKLKKVCYLRKINSLYSFIITCNSNYIYILITYLFLYRTNIYTYI
jgi:hypothetical protein